jgi:hypothetical protein
VSSRRRAKAHANPSYDMPIAGTMQPSPSHVCFGAPRLVAAPAIDVWTWQLECSAAPRVRQEIQGYNRRVRRVAAMLAHDLQETFGSVQ